MNICIRGIKVWNIIVKSDVGVSLGNVFICLFVEFFI